MTKIVEHCRGSRIEVVNNNWRGGSDPPGVTSDPCQAAQVPGSAAKLYIKLELCKQNSKKVRKMWEMLVKKKISPYEMGRKNLIYKYCSKDIIKRRVRLFGRLLQVPIHQIM